MLKKKLYAEPLKSLTEYKAERGCLIDFETAPFCITITNLTKVDIKAYIEERLKEIENKRIADGKEDLEYLSKVMRGEEKDQFGLDASLQDRTKAAELLGKRYRLFTEKVEVDGVQQVQIVDDIDE